MRRKKLGAVMSFSTDSRLKLLVSDKKAAFAVVPQGLYFEKARRAMVNTFRRW